jgi:hypothetical protein
MQVSALWCFDSRGGTAALILIHCGVPLTEPGWRRATWASWEGDLRLSLEPAAHFLPYPRAQPGGR